MGKLKAAKKKPAKGQAVKLKIDSDDIVKGCRQQEDRAFGFFLEGTNDEGMGGLSAMLAVESLVQQEARILSLEMPEGGYFGKEQLPEEIRRYAKMRQEAKEALGKDFEKFYEEGRQSHNDCARTNLDQSDGHMYDYVLPKFNDDGSHEPPGPRDIPWSVKESKEV